LFLDVVFGNAIATLEKQTTARPSIMQMSKFNSNCSQKSGDRKAENTRLGGSEMSYEINSGVKRRYNQEQEEQISLRKIK
jgi:hypothetical protein